MIVLDASVVIAFMNAGDAHSDGAFDLLDEQEWDEFAIHPHTLAEVLVRPSSQGRADEALADLHRIGIERWMPDPGYPGRIAAIRAGSRLSLADCCPLDAAEQLGARLATFDARLAAVARGRGVEVIGIGTQD